MLGLGLGLWDTAKCGGGGSLPAPAAPTLTLTSAPTDNQPDFLVTAAAADLPIGATVTIYAFSDAGLTILVDTGQGVVSVAGTLTVTDQLGPLADGSYWYNADTAIAGHATSAKSNTENNTISTDSAAATNFLARTSGLDATHTNAYKALLNGLTTDGLFNSDGTSDFFDYLYIFATQDQTTALLSLVNNTFSASLVSTSPSITFAADSGFTGANSNNRYVNLGMNPSTASSPKYTQNSAHLSFWNLTNATDAGFDIGTVGAAAGINCFAKFSDNNIYLRINDNPESSGFAIADPRGHIIGNRSTSTARQGFKNAVSIGAYGSQASQAVLNSTLCALGSSASSSQRTMAMTSAGSSLSGTQVTNFYNRLRTYMTAVGVP